MFLVTREYSLGAFQYTFSLGATTDDRGEYRLGRAEPGQAYFLVAGKGGRQLSAISDVPANPNHRKPALVPTYYPDTPFIEGAQPVVLRPGERREGMDIHMSRGPSYCFDGVLEAGGGPASLQFFIGSRPPNQGDIPPGGMSGPDGKIRICDLWPGEYQIIVLRHPQTPQSAPQILGTGLVCHCG